MPTLVYKELFSIRNEIQDVLGKMEALNQTCKTKSTNSIHSKIDHHLEKLQNLKIRMIILEKIQNKLLF